MEKQEEEQKQNEEYLEMLGKNESALKSLKE